MIELIVGTYGFLCWLVFKKFKLVPVNTYTVVTAILGGVVILFMLLLFLTLYHPYSSNGRMYAYTTPIVPDVRGRVISIPVQPNVMLKAGDVLFEIDPEPYRIEVERLRAALVQANTNAAQLKERVDAAEATTSETASRLEAAESELGRQTLEEIEQARAVRLQAATQRDFAAAELKRSEAQYAAGIIPEQDRDVMKAKFDASDAMLKQAEAALRQAEESLGSGSSRIESARYEFRAAEAAEREARLALESESGGMNPEVRQILAELESAEWNLQQATVRAPAAGFVTQVLLRPGQMATQLPTFPTMIFVHADMPELVATFPQNAVQYFEPGLEAELAFKMYPGQIFKAKVKSIAMITPEGQLLPSGQIRTIAPSSGTTMIPVVFEYGPEVAALKMPLGSQVGVAVYTHHIHAISIVRKILIRIKSWENYLFPMSFGH